MRRFKGMSHTLLFGILAAVLTLTAWGIMQSVDPTPPGERILVGFFGWHPIPFSIGIDAFFALLLPLFVVGAARIVTPSAGSFWEFEFRTGDPDYEYGLAWVLAAIFVVLAYLAAFAAKSLGWIAPDNSNIVPIAGIIALLLGMIDRDWIKVAIPAMMVGFLTTAFMIAGFVHGWTFPWTITVVGAVKYAVIPFFNIRASDREPHAPARA